jgi:hypothetical protein
MTTKHRTETRSRKLRPGRSSRPDHAVDNVARRETDRRLPEPTERDGKTSIDYLARKVELRNDELDLSSFLGYGTA